MFFVKVTIDELDEDDHVTSIGNATTSAVDDADVIPSTLLSTKGQLTLLL